MNIRLVQPWTDSNGITHGPGETVEVDAVTLAELETSGAVDGQDQDIDGAAVLESTDVAVSDGTDTTGTRRRDGGGGKFKTVAAVFRPKRRGGSVIRPTRNSGG